MMKFRKIINVAFCLYPDFKSSEGIVNYNWQNILLKKSKNIIQISQKKYVDYSLNEKSIFKIENLLYSILNNNNSILIFFYRVVNRIFILVYSKSQSLYNYLWCRRCYKTLSEKYDSDTVVWLRILPVNPLIPLLKFYAKNNFPFIVNINDPIVAISLIDERNIMLTNEQLLLKKTKDKAQAWTFPSSKLAHLIADKYNLDNERCFVIPHANTPFNSYYTRDKRDIIKILYTGTFYKSAFTEEFKKALQKIQNTPIIENIEFTFVLSQYDDNSIKWLKETIPNVKLKFKLDRNEVITLLKKSDLVLVVDAKTHTDLLKGKLVEAISYGIPVFTPTYQGSIMDSVVTEYGCNAAYQDVKNDLYLKLNDSIVNLNSDIWLNTFYTKREKVIEKFSERNILKATYDITEFAYQRFKGNSEYTIEEIYNWP